MTSHVLLIEDDEAAAYATARTLLSSGMAEHVEIVPDGLAALDYLLCEGSHAARRSGNPSLILLDLKLPHLDGFELLKLIRSRPHLSTIPVFILSASDADENVHRSRLLGGASYLVKPFDVAAFGRAADALSNTSRNPPLPH